MREVMWAVFEEELRARFGPTDGEDSDVQTTNTEISYQLCKDEG